MVIGTGIDIIEVERVKKAAAKPAFLKMVFTPAEQAYFERFNFEPQTIAGTFAAKEATAKALSVGFRGIKWTDIEVLHDENGKPYATLQNAALSRMRELTGKRCMSAFPTSSSSQWRRQSLKIEFRSARRE